jgi:hypothetical protein
MPITVKIRRSGTASATPSALEHGELAINYADGKIYWKNASNVITSFTFQSYALASHTHTASAISDSTTAGRALLTAADAAAQRTTLGLGTLATQSGTFSGTSSGTNTGDQTITLTGDVTGSGTGSFAATLANTAVSAGSYGSASSVATFTTDAKGRLTAASNTTIAIAASAVTSGTLNADRLPGIDGGEVLAPPNAPTSLAASPSSGALALTWTAPAYAGSTSITGYTVEYTPSGGSASTVNTNSASASYTLTGLTNGTSYTVRVRAINSAGSGAYSASATATPATASLLSLVPGAAAAYSLRNLVQGASTPVVRVRRTPDGAFAEFNGAQVRDGTLASWVGAGNTGFVRTWYDQSGNGKDAGTSNSSLQPIIVSSGSVITLNGLPAIDWPAESVNKWLLATITTTSGISTLAVFSAVRRAGGYIKLYNIGSDSGTSNACLTPITGAAAEDWADSQALFLARGFLSGRSPRIVSTGSPIASSSTAQNMLFATLSSSVAAMYVNKTQVSYAAQLTGSATEQNDTTLYIGNNDAGVQQHIGRMQEVIIWGSDKSGSRTLAESEVGAYYGI